MSADRTPIAAAVCEPLGVEIFRCPSASDPTLTGVTVILRIGTLLWTRIGFVGSPEEVLGEAMKMLLGMVTAHNGCIGDAIAAGDAT